MFSPCSESAAACSISRERSVPTYRISRPCIWSVRLRPFIREPLNQVALGTFPGPNDLRIKTNDDQSHQQPASQCSEKSRQVGKLSPTEGRVFIQTHGIPNMDFLCQHENGIARTKTALNLLGLAPWKNTHLLGTSNLISFLLAARRAV